MAAERDIELLDDYLANRMEEPGRSAFEQRLQNDPALKSELELQQQLVNGIKQARVAELKAMMNNVPASALHPGSAAAGKVAFLAVLAALIGTGLYFYFNTSDTETISPSPATKAGQQQRPIETDSSIKDTLKEEERAPLHEDSPVVSTERASSEQRPVITSPKAPTKKKSISSQDPKIEVYDPSREQEESASTRKEERPAARQNNNQAIAVEVDSENKKYNFHYQFREGKLFLYGPFEENLYEILEFFGDDKRTMFLFYNDHYYFLKDDNERLKPLESIQDPVLLKKLKDYRN